jgi:hypothetical protein
MKRHPTRRFMVELLAALASTVLLALTFLRRDWIELFFGVDPDRHGGSLEVVISLLFATAALTLCLLARREWRLMSPAAGGRQTGQG